MAAPHIVSQPLKQFNTKSGVTSLLVSGSSLFVGLENGSIEQWNSPGEVERTLKGHSNGVTCLLQCEEVLWSASFDKTICLWKISSGECIQRLHLQQGVGDLVSWREHII